MRSRDDDMEALQSVYALGMHARAHAHSYKKIGKIAHDTNKSDQSTNMHRIVYLGIFGSWF